MSHRTIALFLFSFWICSASGQIIGLDLIRNKKKVEVPFELEQGFIIVKVWFENVIPLRMIFDTGAENTILFDKEIAQILNLHFDREIAITGSDLDSVIIAHIVRNTRMQMENCYRTKRDIIVLDDNDLLLNEKLGIQVNGIIGGSFFSNLAIKINYSRKRITLMHPMHFQLKDKRYEAFDINVISNKPYLEAEIKNKNKKAISAQLLVDTGASLPFLVHTNTDTSLVLPNRVMVGNVGFGLSGVVRGFLGITERLKFGDFRFDNISTSFQELFIDSLYQYEIVRNGILGNSLLSRFIVIIDYAHEKMYLRANRRYNKAFDFDKSGLTIFAVGQDLNQYYITSVIPQSPAYQAGVRPGDLMLKINGRRTKTLKLEDINHRLSRKSGKRIKLVLKRDDDRIKLEFRLKDWFEDPLKP